MTLYRTFTSNFILTSKRGASEPATLPDLLILSELEEMQWKKDSVRSLVRDAAGISLHDSESVYRAIEEATLAILSKRNAINVHRVEWLCR